MATTKVDDAAFIVVTAAAVSFVAALYGWIINGPRPPGERGEYSDVIFTRRLARVAAKIGSALLLVAAILFIVALVAA